VSKITDLIKLFRAKPFDPKWVETSALFEKYFNDSKGEGMASITTPGTDVELAALRAEHKMINAHEDRDPWKHRSKGMKCRTCMYFVPKVHDRWSPHEIKSENQVGRCRRHAPTMNGYPVVFDSDWCGDHKLNENV